MSDDVYQLTVEERVRNGIAFLDEHDLNWRDRIRPDELDVQSADNCILGQTCGGWLKAERRFALSSKQLLGFGFIDIGGRQGYRVLTDAWRKALAPSSPAPAAAEAIA